jgi:predicted nucleotidyltransferase
MRLTARDRHAIVQATAEVAGPAARALLFGSRTDDRARGGDIDLLIELPQAPADPLGLSLKLSARIQHRVGLRRIDVLVADPGSVPTPLLERARREAVALRLGAGDVGDRDLSP